MQWDWQNRSLDLGVGELASFALFSPGERAAGRWRAELGSRWHEILRERASEEDPGWRFERPVEGMLQREGWSFHVRGRIDQWHAGKAPPLLREVKTIREDLPGEEAELRARYPAYFHQAQLYAWILGPEEQGPEVEVLFLDIQSGITQAVRLGEEDRENLHRHLASVVALLEERRGHFAALRKFAVRPPFPDWRPGQEACRDSLRQQLRKDGPVAMEAPTGFGKTGLALEQALRALVSGEVERILLLTGKTTGQSPLLQQLRTMIGTGGGPTVLALRSRRDHEAGLHIEEPPSPAEIRRRWESSGLSAPALLADHPPGLEEIRSLGLRYGIPPYAVTRLLLPYADIWIADYNYLFDPAVASLFEGMPAFRPEKTFLLVDEAHNLPERAAASRSHPLTARGLGPVLDELQFLRFPGKLTRLCDRLLSFLKKIPRSDALDPPQEGECLVLVGEIFDALRETGFGEDELTPESRDWLFHLAYLLSDWNDPGLSYHLYAPAKGCVHVACLDASAAIAPVLRSFGRCLLMSATLQPWEDYRRRLGLEKEPFHVVEGTAAYLRESFTVYVDGRVDTRYRAREQSRKTTVDTLAGSARPGEECVVAFFPSYAYAESVLAGLRERWPGLRAELQPRDLPLEEQVAFLETALLLDDLLLLVLGSRFSEGIDLLGGRVRSAIVVGPALPEVNGLQKAREAALPGSSEERFHRIYRIPGLRKISQALGRLVRDPHHRARVLLHGRRFTEEPYLRLLPEYLQPREFLTDEAAYRKHWAGEES